VSHVDPENIEYEAESYPVARLDPLIDIEPIVKSTASMEKFRKLGLASDLMVHLQGTVVWCGPTYYLSKSKTHNIGDLMEGAHFYSTVSITITNAFDFGAQATWHEFFPKFRDGTPKPPEFRFTGANVGGERSGHRPPTFFSAKTGTTKMFEEITRCLTA
jgi:hypothetical protein